MRSSSAGHTVFTKLLNWVRGATSVPAGAKKVSVICFTHQSFFALVKSLVVAYTLGTTSVAGAAATGVAAGVAGVVLP